MQKYICMAFILAVSCLARAETVLPPLPPVPLNKVSYMATVEKWATTDTAKVTVSIDAVLDKLGLANVNSHVLDNLTKIAAKADWHITTFTRTQDKSGLEMLHVEAEARLPQNSLIELRDKAKNVSKPGETYAIANIDFNPSIAEIEKAHADARAAVYDAVKQEIARLNQTYPDQHYFLNSLDFTAVQTLPAERSMVMAAVTPQPNQEMQPNIPVNARITETAQVVIAAKLPPALPQ